ncbi:hypothetical protein GCM10027341_38820 [Spirosoma knui]
MGAYEFQREPIVGQPVAITQQPPSSSAVCAGSSVTVPVGASGTGSLTYQWYQNGQLLPDQTSSTLNLPVSTTANSGSYSVVVTGSCNSVLSVVFTLTVNALPTPFTVIGEGGYCAGSAGSPIGLSGSEAGVNYQLLFNSAPLGNALPGNGDPLSFGNYTQVGTYTVQATNPTTGCQQMMTGQISVSVNALPAAFTVTGGGSYCQDGAGVPVSLNGSETGVSYQLLFNGGLSGTAIVGTGQALSFGNQTQPGTYTVRATNIATTCNQLMAEQAVVSVTPLPTTFTVTGGGAYCAGSGGISIGLSSSQTGISYQLLLNGSISVSAVTGTGQPISFGNQTQEGTYTVQATNPTTGCQQTMTGQASVSITPLPDASFTGLSSQYCLGSPASSLNPIVNGGQFELLGAGTLNSISFSPTSVGSSTITYSITVNGCSNTTSQSLTVNALPTPTLSNTGPLSFTNTTVSLSATGGTSYSFSTGANQVDNGPTARVTTAGVYSVTVTDANGCSSSTSTTVAGGNNPTVCRGGTAVINVVVEGDPAKYEWYKNNLTTPKIMETPQLFRGTATSSLTLINAQTNTQGNFFLKVTDRSGAVKVYGPYRLTVDASCRAREVAIEGIAEPGLQVTILGNPVANGQLRALVQGAAGQHLQVELRDSQGRSIRSQRWTQAQPDQFIEWDISQQPAGLYLLQAQTDQHTQQHKIIKP